MNGVCKAAPYEGQDKFVYVHFCKEDHSAAYTLIERLAREGYRIFYAAPPVDTDRIGEKLMNCTVFMPLYSRDAADSHDFRKVVTAAVLSGKEIAPVFLEEVELSPGMRLQFNENKRVNWYSMWCAPEMKPGVTLRACKGDARPEIKIQERSLKTTPIFAVEEKKRPAWGITTFEDEEEVLKKLMQAKAERKAAEEKAEAERKAAEEQAEAERKAAEEKAEAERKAAEEQAEAERKAAEEKAEAERRAAEEKAEAERRAAEEKAEAERRAAEEKAEAERKAAEEKAEAERRAAEEKAEAERRADEEREKAERVIAATEPVRRTLPVIEEPRGARRRRGNAAPVSKTVMLDEDMEERLPRKSSGTVIIEEMPPVVVRMKTGEVFEGRCGVTTVGRTEDNDVCIPGETVSGRHLEIICVPDGENRGQIVDCHSSNGTWIDGQKMERGGRLPVEGYIRLSLSKPEPCFILFGEVAAAVKEKGVLACLECRETREMKLLLRDEMTFGRSNPWEEGAFDEAHISGSHAVFTREGDRFAIRDVSSNGTRINAGNKLPRNIPVDLNSGDVIEMGRQHFVFTCVALKEK